MKYKIVLDNDNYLDSFVHTGTKDDTYELDATTLDLGYVNCYKLVNGKLLLDEEKKKQTIKEREAEKERTKEISEQTLRLAEMFMAMGVNSNDFIDRIDAQTLYTALMTDTLIESEDNNNE